MTEAEVIDDKGRAAALSRNYGLDVDMADSALAASSVASRDYQKQCLHIYREFIKNMNCHLKDEKEVRDELNKLRKEKITNMKYSLYRSAGEDVFSSAKQKRQKMMENMAIVSPLIFDDTRMNTPWGLDNIIDEDLLRPQTAPAHKVTGSEEGNGPVEDTEGRPQTVSNTNYRPLDFLDDITMELEMNQRHIGGREAPLSPTTHVPTEFVPQPSPTKTERVRFATPNPRGDNSDEKAESDEETDGVVDPMTERTRARKITINSMSFAKLSIGEIMAKLKHKDGKFNIKPISMNYTPNEVDAVFIAKDPTKEKMALVRQKTTCNSSTIASDLKVNNRIAIMKSLMGIKVKKKTVSEIFDNGRDRKTRHFRIVLKNPKGRNVIPEPVPTEVSKGEDEYSVPIHVSITPIIPKKPNLKHTSGSNDVLANQRSTPLYTRDPQARTGRVPTIHTNYDTDGAFVRTSSFGSRLGYDHARNDSRMSVTSSVSQDPLQRSLNSRNMHYNGRTHHSADVVDNGLQTPINRSVSVMSGRESVIFQGTDAATTEMIRMLVEGEGRGGTGKLPGGNRPASRASGTTSVAGSHFGRRMKTPSRRMATPSSMLSDSEMSYGGVNRPQSVNKRTTTQMVKDLIQQDKEYQENMDTMRRRMASSGRRSSIAIRKL